MCMAPVIQLPHHHYGTTVHHHRITTDCLNEQLAHSCCRPALLQLTTPHRRPGLARTMDMMRPRQLLAQPMQVAADETMAGTMLVPPVNHGASEVPIPERAPAGGCQP